MKRIVVVICVAAVLSCACGCGFWRATAGSTGIITIKQYSYEVTKVHKAALAALKEAKIEIVSEKADVTSGLIVAKLADGADLKVESKMSGDNVTEVCVRLGGLGDSQRRQGILSLIDKEL